MSFFADSVRGRDRLQGTVCYSQWQGEEGRQGWKRRRARKSVERREKGCREGRKGVERRDDGESLILVRRRRGIERREEVRKKKKEGERELVLEEKMEEERR